MPSITGSSDYEVPPCDSSDVYDPVGIKATSTLIEIIKQGEPRDKITSKSVYPK